MIFNSAHPLPLFEDYLKRGYYPFSLEENYEQRLQQIVNQSLEADIPMHAGMNVSTSPRGLGSGSLV